ncbi:MAG TPA: penicillin-binding protein 2 [Blastocatellia bacterium]|nr:penicillin-binding protein 2 [Blastocatellia bacterium]
MAFPVRFHLLRYAILVCLVGLGIRFWTLQVLDHNVYFAQSENNRIREITIRAPRGNILDRYGRVLVDSRPSMNVIVLREDIQDENETIKALVDNFRVDRDSLIEQLHDTSVPKAQPIIVKRDANEADRAWIAAHDYEHPEIQLEPQPKRRYIYGELAAHALGFVGEISPDQLKMDKYKGFKRGDIIGQSGIEQSHNDVLMGVDGKRRVIVDRLNRVRGELDTIPPTPGHDLVTTIDLDLQEEAEKEMEGKRGVAIMMDPRNGEILAMVSKPSFDPNIFSDLALRISSPETKKQYQELLLDPSTPLINRGTQGIYPTGSTWKILMTAAGLDAGVITEKNSSLPCGGGIQLGNRFIHCDRFHGTPDIRTAITVSCDGYFYRLALKLGVDKIHEYVSDFGMGKPTGIDLREVSGIIPDRAWKRRVNPRDPEWKDVDTAWCGIGQGSVAVPPIQLIHGIDGLIMGGDFHTPHLLKEVRGVTGDKALYQDSKEYKFDLKPNYLQIIKDGMWGAVNGPGGTAHAAHIDGIDICGKTGTAQVIADRKASGKHKDHAWFVSFAPKDAPEISSVVLVENSGFGGANAAPVTRMLMGTYFMKKFGHPVIPEQKMEPQQVAVVR